MYVILKVQCEWNWRGAGSLSVFWYAQMEKSSFRSLISVPLESSVLGVREGRVRGSRWYFSPRALYVIGVAQTWSSIPELCVRAERLMSWRCQGISMCIGMASGGVCWFVCRTCGEKHGLCIVLVRRNI